MSASVGRTDVMDLSTLQPPKGRTHSKKRVGRGPGSGTGTSSISILNCPAGLITRLISMPPESSRPLPSARLAR